MDQLAGDAVLSKPEDGVASRSNHTLGALMAAIDPELEAAGLRGEYASFMAEWWNLEARVSHPREDLQRVIRDLARHVHEVHATCVESQGKRRADIIRCRKIQPIKIEIAQEIQDQDDLDCAKEYNRIAFEQGLTPQDATKCIKMNESLANAKRYVLATRIDAHLTVIRSHNRIWTGLRRKWWWLHSVTHVWWVIWGLVVFTLLLGIIVLCVRSRLNLTSLGWVIGIPLAIAIARRLVVDPLLGKWLANWQRQQTARCVDHWALCRAKQVYLRYAEGKAIHGSNRAKGMRVGAGMGCTWATL